MHGYVDLLHIEKAFSALAGHSRALAPALFHTLKGEYCMVAKIFTDYLHLQGPVYRFFYLENQTLNALARYYLQHRKFIDEEVPEDLNTLQPV